MALRQKDTICTTQIMNKSSIVEMLCSDESDAGVEKEKNKQEEKQSMELDDLSEEEIVNEPEVEQRSMEGGYQITTENEHLLLLELRARNSG